MKPTQLVLDSGSLPNDHLDARLIRRYEADGGDIDDLIYLSLGETWTSVAPGLAATLADRLPAHTHGYTLSPYGLPALRDALQAYITRTHHLPEPDAGNFDVAVSQSGTRAAMSDFGHLLLGGPEPTVLVPSPGWDYAGVFAPLGFRLLPYGLSPATEWQPEPAEVESLLNRVRGEALLVLNPQHNPTGVEWSSDKVRSLVGTAVAHGAAILLDDAYYALHAPGKSPTNVLRILVEETAQESVQWLAVRTLGKQFHCNGWGIGALTARPPTLAQVARVTQQRSYGCALPLQAAMATWLQSDAADSFVDGLRRSYAAARLHVARRLHRDLGFPPDAVPAGTCSAYLRFRVPPRHVRDASEEPYRRLCLAVGVLLGAGSMTDSPALLPSRGVHPEAYVRLFLGQPLPVLDEALDRLARADLGW
ncbi:aminotransferase [Nocardiopsis terrae]|uniref:N-succinyldiaminopimelate aminotransferase n=1 Tax=Nocardiopsis terrae TaxID=372655 RepID=A0ABR9HD40_9ACTN|nr:pyridoxal phosphate-dependent aminotransferase [Nocardiopsis terrae]MBE1456949.1 N-succinyldiaminopimelate aminotransferase [Nocardiopsis terrae]GHC89767.1 aminotransferase [Nocardiopsis terrae]